MPKMKALDKILGPIVIVLAEYEKDRDTGVREYYGLSFVEYEVGSPSGFESDEDIEKADAFQEEAVNENGKLRTRYVEFDDYRCGIWCVKLHSPREIMRYKMILGRLRTLYQINRRRNGARIIFRSALSYRRIYPLEFYHFLYHKLGIQKKSEISKENPRRS